MRENIKNRSTGKQFRKKTEKQKLGKSRKNQEHDGLEPK